MIPQVKTCVPSITAARVGESTIAVICTVYYLFYWVIGYSVVA